MKKSYTLETLPNLCKEIVTLLDKNGGIVLLRGTLAAGKTTFVQEFVKFLGLHVKVSSPTFSIMNEYEEKVKHYDIYQKGLNGFLQSGLLEGLSEEKYHLIEWAGEDFERMLNSFGFDYICINIELKNSERLYEVTEHAHS
jgi:tRNA threonylcarbamoyladenosine biosynthesis protein TsaE